MFRSLALIVLLFNVFVNNVHAKYPEPCIKGTCIISNYIGDNKAFELDSHEKYVHITSLKFSNSTIKELTAEFLKNFNNLTTLDLSYCGVEIVRQKTFFPTGKLQDLILSNNNITEILESQFFGASNLVNIDLSHNQIQKIDENSFKYLNKLKKIDLSNNNIKTLNKGILDFNRVILDDNKLESLNLSNSGVSTLSANNNMIPSDNVSSSDSENLIDLSLRNNSLTNLNFISNMTNLVRLDVSYNPLDFNLHFDLTVFKNLVTLKQLYLRSVRLNESDYAILEKLPHSLEILDISANNLHTLDLHLLSDLDNLTQLNINDNYLGNVTFRELKYLFHNLKKIDISENEWICSNLIETLTLMEQKSVKLIMKQREKNPINKYIRGISCTGPTEIDDDSMASELMHCKQELENINSVDKMMKIDAQLMHCKQELENINSVEQKSTENITITGTNDNNTSTHWFIALFVITTISLVLNVYSTVQRCRQNRLRRKQGTNPSEDIRLKNRLANGEGHNSD